MGQNTVYISQQPTVGALRELKFILCPYSFLPRNETRAFLLARHSSGWMPVHTVYVECDPNYSYTKITRVSPERIIGAHYPLYNL